MNRLLLIAAMAMAGILGTVAIAFDQDSKTAFCPMLGAVPSCVFVLGGYAAMFAATLFTNWRAATVFLTGWMLTLSVSVSGALSGLTGAPIAFASAVPFLASLLSVITAIVLGAIWAQPYLRRPVWSRR